MTNRNDWEGRTGRKWADEWRRTDRSFAGLTAQLLTRARAAPIRQAIDIGCGAGEVTLALSRDRADAEIVGLDISESLIEAARARGANHTNARFAVADAASWSEPAFAPDLLVSRHGVMFFDDPVAAFTHLGDIAAPSARLLFSCFRDRAKNPWAAKITDLLPPGVLTLPEPGTPGPFAFAEPAHVERILTDAGWHDIAFEAVDFAYVAGAGGDPVSDAVTYFMAIGPAATAAAELDHEARGAFLDRLESFLAGHRDGAIVALPAAAWIVSARAP